MLLVTFEPKGQNLLGAIRKIDRCFPISMCIGHRPLDNSFQTLSQAHMSTLPQTCTYS